MKIICIGRNYLAHAAELNNPVPEYPLVFMKPSTSLLVNGKPFYYPAFSKDVHYEVEVVLKVSKNGRHIQPEHANSYFDELTLGIDFTARDLQKELKQKGHPWELSKAFDNAAVVGTFLDCDSLRDVSALSFLLKKNGVMVQEGNTRDLIFDFQTLIAYTSQYFKLQAGDLIFTGTPAGVGPISIGDNLKGFIGDTVVLECEIR
ncbi:MAG: fumarylacetoacetate hydrolase family protein [Saprospiraceae bacterium]|nr:fumarylacetoacetate hydrolase family protein [Saprospiraceae bacterium]